MLFQKIISNVINTVILFFSIPIGKYIVDFLKIKKSNEKHSALKDAAHTVVHAAEYFFSDKNTNEKINYSCERLKKKFPWASHIKIKEFVHSIYKEIQKK